MKFSNKLVRETGIFGPVFIHKSGDAVIAGRRLTPALEVERWRWRLPQRELNRAELVEPGQESLSGSREHEDSRRRESAQRTLERLPVERIPLLKRISFIIAARSRPSAGSRPPGSRILASTYFHIDSGCPRETPRSNWQLCLPHCSTRRQAFNSIFGIRSGSLV